MTDINIGYNKDDFLFGSNNSGGNSTSNDKNRNEESYDKLIDTRNDKEGSNQRLDDTLLQYNKNYIHNVNIVVGICALGFFIYNHYK
tara:strand:- start:1004 stop:1264 length:261 start_codon:yes stop_codon:yes gene_type:complete